MLRHGATAPFAPPPLVTPLVIPEAIFSVAGRAVVLKKEVGGRLKQDLDKDF